MSHSGWFYLSYATPDGFLGAAHVRADDVLEAVGVAVALGIAPEFPEKDFGGNYEAVQGCPVPAGCAVPEWAQNVLLSREDLIRLDGPGSN